MNIPLFTLVFLVFLVGSNERVATIRSKVAMPQPVCEEKAEETADMVIEHYLQDEGMKVKLLAFCVPEERKA